MGDHRFVVRIVGLALGLVAILLQGRRLAAKSGGARVFRVTIVSLMVSAAVVIWSVNRRLHQRAARTSPSVVSAIPAPSDPR